MDRKGMLKLLAGTIVALHIGFYIIKPLVISPREPSQIEDKNFPPKY